MEEQAASNGVKLVPWMSWDEWLFVYDSLFSRSPLSVHSALTRISTWRGRGCLPVTVEVTASIIDIQLRDPQLRSVDAADENQEERRTEDASLSDEMLAMLYCMAIMRLVNGVVEKTRNQREVSIAVAADAIGLPRSLIDIRHEGSHRELPALQVVRSAAAKALDWLISCYWEPQKKAIPFHGDSATKIRKGIESKLHEVAFCLKDKETSQSPSSLSLKGKGNKKQMKKILKNLVGLYSSWSVEVVSVLLDFLLKALNSPILTDTSLEHVVDPCEDALLEDWKPVIKKLSYKEPEVIVSLLRTILDKVEIQENMKYETGRRDAISSDNEEVQLVEHLSSLFTWLIRNLKQLKPCRGKDSALETKSSLANSIIPKETLMQLLRKCLMLSVSGNKLLMNSTFHIVQLIGEDHLLKKLDKLSTLVLSNSEIIHDDSSSLTNPTVLLTEQDEFMSRAAKKLELIKSVRRKRKVGSISSDSVIGSSGRWVVSTTWNPCPIGMLPNSAGSSGTLPVLDYEVGPNKRLIKNLELTHSDGTPKSMESDECSFKKMRMTNEGDIHGGNEDVFISPGVKDQLMVGGVWTKVEQEDLCAIKSSVRILV